MNWARHFPLVCVLLFHSLAAHGKTRAPLGFRPPLDFIVVLDPGHGGQDTGALYKEGPPGKSTLYTEKALTLLIAKDLARELIIRGYQVVLTRNDDRDTHLTDRTAMANKVKANIFISIHLNSTPELNGAHGIETFILNHATDASSRRLADLENSVLKESQANEAGKSSNVSLIMKDMILDANLTPSKALACAIQNNLKKGTKNRGVRQALFYVLLGADMPSVLIEAGFMNSKEDRERALNPLTRQRLVNQIAGAVEDFRLKKTSTSGKVV